MIVASIVTTNWLISFNFKATTHGFQLPARVDSDEEGCLVAAVRIVDDRLYLCQLTVVGSCVGGGGDMDSIQARARGVSEAFQKLYWPSGWWTVKLRRIRSLHVVARMTTVVLL